MNGTIFARLEGLLVKQADSRAPRRPTEAWASAYFPGSRPWRV